MYTLCSIIEHKVNYGNTINTCRLWRLLLQRLEILCNENFFGPVACVDIDIEKAKKIEISTNTQYKI